MLRDAKPSPLTVIIKDVDLSVAFEQLKFSLVPLPETHEEQATHFVQQLVLRVTSS